MDAEDEEECPQCGRLERTHEGGTLFCAHCGFALGSAVFDEEEDREYGRTGTIIRKKEDKVRQKYSKIYRGPKGYKLFLQAWQHVLWRQCHAAIHVGGLPPELWTVVKDLWTLRLSKLGYRLEEPLALNAESSGGDDLDTDATSNKNNNNINKDDQVIHMASPKFIESLGLLYLGSLLLRIPLRIQTLHDWIMEDVVPFIRPIRYIPAEISRHLASEYVSLFQTNSIPTAQQLHYAVFATCKMYSKAFRMALPPLNVSPLLQDMVESLALPLEVYGLAKQLNSIASFTFTYPSAPVSRRQPVSTYPEAQLVSLIVLATKLLFPFDAQHVQRYPSSLSQPGALLLNWAEWVKLKDSFQKSMAGLKEHRGQTGSHLLTNDLGVMSMTDNQLDKYMDWYQDTFARVHDRDDSPLGQQVLDMFPLPDCVAIPVAVKAENNKEFQGEKQRLRIKRLEDVLNKCLNTQTPVSEEEAESKLVLRPGMKFPRISSVTDLDGPAEAFYQEAADISSLTLDQLVHAVRHTELKFEKWRHEQRRKEMWPEDG